MTEMQTATQMKKSSQKSDSGPQMSMPRGLFRFRGLWLGILLHIYRNNVCKKENSCILLTAFSILQESF